MPSLSQVAVVLGFVAGVGTGCAEPKKADKKLELQRETLRRLDAGPAAASPHQPTRMTPEAPPTNMPPDPPPPVTHQAPRPTNQAPR